MPRNSEAELIQLELLLELLKGGDEVLWGFGEGGFGLDWCVIGPLVGDLEVDGLCEVVEGFDELGPLGSGHLEVLEAFLVVIGFDGSEAILKEEVEGCDASPSTATPTASSTVTSSKRLTQ